MMALLFLGFFTAAVLAACGNINACLILSYCSLLASVLWLMYHANDALSILL